MLKFVSYGLLFFITFLLDRVTKYLVVSQIMQNQIVNNFFNIYLTFNRGIAWGIGSDMQDMYTIFLYIFIGLVLAYFIYYLTQIWDNKIIGTASILILSGGISNFIDRVWYGSVIDFIQLHWVDWYFPIFNIADVSITIGAIIFIFGIFNFI